MDLNQLLFHHQVALIRSEGPDSAVLRGSRFDLVSHYERRIARLRHDIGVKQLPGWLASPSAAAI